MPLMNKARENIKENFTELSQIVKESDQGTILSTLSFPATKEWLKRPILSHFFSTYAQAMKKELDGVMLKLQSEIEKDPFAKLTTPAYAPFDMVLVKVFVIREMLEAIMEAKQNKANWKPSVLRQVKSSYLFQLAEKLHDLAKGGEKMRQVYEDVQNGHKDTRALNDAEFYFSGDYTVLQLPGQWTVRRWSRDVRRHSRS